MSNNQDFTILLKVRADLNQALGGIRQLKDGIGSLKSAALGIAGSLGVAFSVAGLLAFVKSTIDADQALGDLSKKVGVSTETLSALGSEAKKSGTDLGAVQSAFVKLAQAATDSSGKGSQALRAMGIDLKAFLDLKPEQQFDLVAQKFASYNDGAKKAALATALFGKAGADLIPLLNSVGNQGLGTLTQKAIDSGTAVGTDAVNAAKAFGDALNDLKDKLQGAVNQGLVQMTPQVQALSALISDPQFIKALGAVAQGIATITVKATEGAAELVNFVQWLGEAAAAHFNGPNDPVRIDDRITEIDKQLKSLGKDGGVSIDLSAGKVQDLFRSADTRRAQLIAERTKLEALLKVVTPPVPKAQDKALSGDAVPAWMKAGLGGKSDAPVIGDPQKARAMAAALDQLQGRLDALKTQGLDPAATAWAQYNKTVSDATATAAKAGNTPAALSALKSITAEAARIRDAQLDKILQQDKDAYEQLRRSLDTPIEAKIDDAKEQVEALNKALAAGVITAQQYQEQFQRIGAKAFEGSKLPDFAGLSPQFGASGEFARIDQATKELDKAYQAQKQLNDAFHANALESEQEYLARSLALNQEYAAKKAQIQHATDMLAIQQMTQSFDQAAALTGQAFGQQSGAYRVMFDLAKAAAIAQATVAMFQNIAEASKVGFPANLALMASAMAQGMTIVADVRAIQLGGATGYAAGGYTGEGGKYQVAGVVHKGEGVLSQGDIAALGGPAGFFALQQHLRGYAEGGFVAGPSLDDVAGRLRAPRMPAASLPQRAANDDAARAPQVGVRIINSVDPQFVTDHMASSAGERVILNTIARNQSRVKALIG